MFKKGILHQNFVWYVTYIFVLQWVCLVEVTFYSLPTCWLWYQRFGLDGFGLWQLSAGLSRGGGGTETCPNCRWLWTTWTSTEQLQHDWQQAVPPQSLQRFQCFSPLSNVRVRVRRSPQVPLLTCYKLALLYNSALPWPIILHYSPSLHPWGVQKTIVLFAFSFSLLLLCILQEWAWQKQMVHVHTPSVWLNEDVFMSGGRAGQKNEQEDAGPG